MTTKLNETAITPEQALDAATQAGSWIHSPLVMMIVVGLLGGYLSWTNSVYEKSRVNEPICKMKLWKHLITGIMATLMVPLFLQMIGSSLLGKISPNNSQFYVFLGFCSAAAYVSQRFAGTISERLLKDVAEKANHAEQEVDKLKVNQLRLQGNIHFLEGEYSKALAYFSEYLALCPEDTNTLCRAAYSLKRKGQYGEALNLINKAIGLEKDQHWILYYNKACYLSLLYNNDGKVDDIIEALKTAERLSDGGFTKAVQDDLENDFKAVSSLDEFKNYVKSVGIEVK